MNIIRILMFINLISIAPLEAKKALVMVPVADLVGNPIKSFGLAKTNRGSYENLAICGYRSEPSLGAPRIHQALFNEVVEILSIHEGKNGDESQACITYDAAYFITHDNHNPQNIYWTLTKNLITLEKLSNRGLSLDPIPATPSFKDSHAQVHKPTVTLIKPYYDATTHQTFSAGTHFVFDPELSTATHYHTSIFDRTCTQYQTTMIPKEVTHVVNIPTPAQAIECFLTILKQWTHTKKGIIPYVWGGCSFTKYVKNISFSPVTKTLSKGQKITVYERVDCKNSPITGCDCAGLILLILQKICNAPYFFKNTYTLAHHLKTVAIDDHVAAGDLIWIPGHVMIVSNLENNMLVEARGYSHGFGRVHEIPLEKVFKGIKTYKDLQHALLFHKPLIRLNKEGREVEKISKGRILKMLSLWK